MKYDKYGNKKDTMYYMKIVMAIILVFMIVISTIAGLF